MKGIWHLWVDRCKGCGICIEVCPLKALNWSSELSTKGYFFPILDEKKCNYCGACDLFCPDLAILAVREKELKEVTI
jgi:2-oxoglutarate ferredoxin oxidoreductase subunit delta